MSIQNKDIADTRPIHVSPPKTQKPARLLVWLLGGSILLLLFFCVGDALLIGFLSIKGRIILPAVIPVVQAAQPASTRQAPSVPAVQPAQPTFTPLAETAISPVNGILATPQPATAATATEQNGMDPAMADPAATLPPNSWPGNTYRATDCDKLAPDLLVIITQTGKPFDQIGATDKLAAFEFPPLVFQEISILQPLCAQHVIFSEVNNTCTPVICSIETGAIIFPDANTAKTGFSLIDQAYQSTAKNKAMLKWTIANTNATSCFSESSPAGAAGSAIHCTVQDGNSIFISSMVSGDPFSRTFADAAGKMFLDIIRRNGDLANQANPSPKK